MVENETPVLYLNEIPATTRQKRKCKYKVLEVLKKSKLFYINLSKININLKSVVRQLSSVTTASKCSFSLLKI